MSDPKLIPPSLAEVREFLASLGSAVDPERFYDFYESNGWKVGRTRMVNWHATARNWSRQDKARIEIVRDLTEWERKQKLDRLRDLRERKRAITNPGGSAFSVSLDADKLAVVQALEEKIESLKKELNE